MGSGRPGRLEEVRRRQSARRGDATGAAGRDLWTARSKRLGQDDAHPDVRRSRCSLACAIGHKPQLLLLDEPTVGVDPQLRVELWDGFKEMADAGTTIIVSSHVMDEAERCQRLGLILFGKLLIEGSPGEIRARAGKPTLDEAFLPLSESRS